MISPRWFRRLALALVVLLGPLYFVVSQERSQNTILNLVFDRGNDTLIAVSGVEAQGPELTLTEIFNRVLRDGGGGTYYLALTGSGVGALSDLTDVDITSTPPTDGQALVWSDTVSKFVPNDVLADAVNVSYSDLLDVDVTTLPAGNGYVPIWNSSIEKWQASAFPAGQTAITANSLRFTPSTQSGSCTLGANSLVILTAGGAVDCALPDPSDAATPGFYHILIQDDNPVTLSPAGTDLLNGTNAALPAIRGPLASFTVYRESATAWRATQVSSAGYGELVTTLCALTGGDTNNAASGSGAYVTHTLSCNIPANTLQVGAVVETCAAWGYTTGADGPTLHTALVAGAAVVANNTIALQSNDNVTLRTMTQCWFTVVSEAPSAASATVTSVIGDLNSLISGASTSSVAQPVDLASNAIVSLAVRSQWDTAGTGTNTFTLLSLIVRLSGVRKT